MSTVASVALLALPALAEKKNPEDVNALWYWAAIFVFLVIAVVVLYLSLRKQLKRVDFEEKAPDERPGQERP